MLRPHLYLLARTPTDSVRDGFLPAAARLGLDVTVLTDHEELHRARTPDAEVIACDVRDFHAVVTAIARHRPAAGVFSNSDHLQTQTALAADYFGLPGKPWPATLRAEDKAELRRHLAATGADVVWSREIPPGLGPDDVEAAPAAFPVVLKPREGVASEDVTLVRDPAELSARCAEVHSRRPSSTLVVEEYLPGRLRSLETLGDGRVRHVLGGFETELSPPPHFVETRMRFVADPPAAEVAQVLAQLDALEVGLGACHTEYVVDGSGRARIIEVNYRAVGDRCDLLLADLLEIPLFELVLLTHLGHPLPPALDRRTDRRARVEYPTASIGGTLVGAPGPRDLEEQGVRLRYRPLRDLGERHPRHCTNRDYLGVLTATGPDQHLVDRAAARFLADNRWEIAP